MKVDTMMPGSSGSSNGDGDGLFLERRRPKRQRTPTTMYTDDKPGTYTKKGVPQPPPPKPSFYFVEEDEEEQVGLIGTHSVTEQQQESHSHSHQSSRTRRRSMQTRSPRQRRHSQSIDSEAASVSVSASVSASNELADQSETPSKRSYRRRKPYHKDDMLEKTTAQKFEEQQQLQLEKQNQEQQDQELSQPPVKRKRGRPPKKRPSICNNGASAGTNGSKSTTTNTSLTSALPTKDEGASTATQTPITAASSSSPRKSQGKRVDSFFSSKKSSTPIIEDISGHAISHSCYVQPMLPHPEWKPLYEPDVYYDADYDINGALSVDLEPVSREITCLAIRKNDSAYLAMGDSMGFCIIYSLGTHIRPVARLETIACQKKRTSRENHNNKTSQQSSSFSTNQQTKRKKQSNNLSSSIQAIDMIGERVVLATSGELECLDIPSQTSLWVCPLSHDRLVTYLDMHPTRFDVLVSCQLHDAAATYGQTSPLMLLQHSSNNVEVCDANAPILLRSPCCTAIWDNSKTQEDRLLFCVVAGEDLELVLVQGGSIDNWKVACKTRIPVKASTQNRHTRLSQSGEYTLVAGSRGIRLYQTETLQLVHVYGDQLALHGRSVVWKDCLMLQGSLEEARTYQDWFLLNTSTNDTTNNGKMKDCGKKDSAGELGHYIVGVPQKGPKELLETLHIWKVEQPAVVPAMSLPLPPKSEGVQALTIAPGDRIVLATQMGDGFILEPTMKSDFAGIMYPPGYKVIRENTIYMEAEDELDQVINKEEGDEKSTSAEKNSCMNMAVDLDTATSQLNEDLKEAMRQSLLEQKKMESIEDPDVDVISFSNTTIEEQACVPIIPCRPEAYLKQAINSQPDDYLDDADLEEEQEEVQRDGTILTSPAKKGVAVQEPKLFVTNILESLGHANPKKHEGGGDFSFSVTAKVVIAAAPPKAQKHAKKSRAANLESMLKASIDPQLQRFMFSKQACGSNGKGSSLDPSSIAPPAISNHHSFPQPAYTIENGRSNLQDQQQLKGRRQVEADVALGLLGLSPSPTNESRSMTPTDAISEFVSETASRTSSQVVGGKDPNCYACLGRLVIHTCGTRALPIDVDEVSKQEREAKEREEERKKKAKAEKRRLADQRRREARKQKQRELEEQRHREEEEARIEQDRLHRIEEAKATAAAAMRMGLGMTDSERQRREMIVASYSNHMSHSAPLTTTSTTIHVPQSLEVNSVDYSAGSNSQRQTCAMHVSAPASGSMSTVVSAPATMNTHPPANTVQSPVSSTGAAVVVNKVGFRDSDVSHTNGHSARACLPSSTSMGTLDSADALVALASFAGIKAEQQEQDSTAAINGQGASAFKRPASAALAMSHGFGNGSGGNISTNASVPAIPKRAIPSFASLRGQINGEGSHASNLTSSRLIPNNSLRDNAAGVVSENISAGAAASIYNARGMNSHVPLWQQQQHHQTQSGPENSGVTWPPQAS